MNQTENQPHFPQKSTQIKYASFIDRLIASIIDSVLVLFIVSPFLGLIVKPPLILQNLARDLHNKVITEEQYVSEFSYFFFEQGGMEIMIKDSIISFLLLGSVIVAFWFYRMATPGKILLNMKVVNEKDFTKPGNEQLIIRYIAYLVSSIPFFMGFAWMLFDKKNQTWHDKIAGTAVIKG